MKLSHDGMSNDHTHAGRIVVPWGVVRFDHMPPPIARSPRAMAGAFLRLESAMEWKTLGLQFRPKYVQGLYNYAHYEHDDGTWFQIGYGRPFRGHYRNHAGDILTFDSPRDMQTAICNDHTKGV